MKKLLLLLFITTSVSSFSQATLVKDINQGNNDGAAKYSKGIEFKGYSYMMADDGINGMELWRTDGTEAGTVLFKSFRDGIDDGMYQQEQFFFKTDSYLYFFAWDGTTNFGLWRTDGTTSGIVKVTAFSTRLREIKYVNLNDVLIFSFENNNNYYLWKSDGTQAGTSQLKEMRVLDMVSFSEKVFMGANGNDGNGSELWETDGTQAGTILFKDIVTGASSSFSNDLKVVNNQLVFRATNSSSEIELWKSDGTEANTVLVKNITTNLAANSYFRDVVATDTHYFFSIYNAGKYAIWKSDATDAGTTEIISDIYLSDMVATSQKMLAFNWTNILVYDGTTLTTINTDAQGYHPHNGFTVIEDKVYMQGKDDNGYEIWVTDGTDNGTYLVKDIHPSFDDNNIERISSFNGKAIFSAKDGNWHGKEYWISDGTETGTMMLKDINQTGSRPSYPKNFIAFNNQTFFSADNGVNGVELWKTDGTTTTLVKDINLDIYYSNPTEFVKMNGVLYFKATTKSNGTELWKTDGTATGTTMVKDINPNESNGLNLGNIVVLNNKLYFFANDGTNGFELWKSDGTDAGTILIKDIYSGASDSYRNGEIIVFNNNLYFNAQDGSNDFELWKSDGTEAGTVLFSNLNTSGSGSPDNFIHFNSELYFRANSTSGSGLWRTDGTSTFLVSNKGYNNLTVAGANLYFVSTYDNGGELWRTDGTSTVEVKDIRAGSGGSNGSFPSTLTNHNGILYFKANDGTNGYELWKSDGTEAGTQMVKDINTSGSSNINDMVSFGNRLVFGAAENGINKELWKSDGTDTGTVLFQEINPTTSGTFPSSYPKNFFINGSTLYFTADNGTIGEELYKLDQSALSVEKVSKEFTDVSVFPNPTNGILNLKIENQEILQVKVYSLFGKEVMRISAKNNVIENINLQHLSTGMYVLKIKTISNTYSKKVIKR